MFNKSKKEKHSKIAKIEKLNKAELTNVVGGAGTLSSPTTQVSSINYNASKSNTGN